MLLGCNYRKKINVAKYLLVYFKSIFFFSSNALFCKYENENFAWLFININLH